MGTISGGLVRFNPKSGETKRFTVDDGLQGNTFFWTSRLKTSDGELWFGGANGISSFDPSQIRANPHAPPVVLTALTQGGLPIDTGTSPVRLKEVTLDGRNNYFEFQFSALNFIAPQRNRYAYKLEGWDDQWYESGSIPRGRYSGLSSGEYTLKLKASNNDGVWNEIGASVKVIVTPPFWETSSFYLAMTTVGVFLAFAMGFYIFKMEREVRERKLAEAARGDSDERVRLLLDSTAEAIYGLDLNGNCTFCNPACLRLLGYEDSSQLLGQNMHDLIHRTRPHGSAAPMTASRVFDALQQGQDTHVDDEVLWRADSSSFAAEYWSHPIRHNGDIVGSVVTFLDITERKQAEKDHKILQDQLRHSQKMDAIGQLAAGVAHEFNNILVGIRGNAELLLRTSSETDLPDNMKRPLKDIERSGVRAFELTQQLLSFSRYRSPNVAVFDINRTVAKSEKMLKRLIGANISIKNQLSVDPALVRADEAEIEQTILNLVLNARDAMPDGGNLTIRTRIVTLAEGEVSQAM